MMTKSTVNNILNKKFHPHHIKLNRDLKETDFQKREDFCVSANNKIVQNPVFMNIFLMSKKASCGEVNRHNYYTITIKKILIFIGIEFPQDQDSWSCR